jgi:hypothetical protein
MFFKSKVRWTNPRLSEKPYNTAWMRIVAWTIFSVLLLTLVIVTISTTYF